MNQSTINTEDASMLQKLDVEVITGSHRSIDKYVDVEMDSYCGPFLIYKNARDVTDGTAFSDDSEEMIETNAFGQMEFIGGESKTRAKYIRLSDKTEMEHVGALLQTSWGLNEWPKIIISVLGGVHKFDIEPDVVTCLKKELKNLCFKVSNMDDATWFVTKATDSGVTKLVAEAMQGNKYKNTFVIGITQWEDLHGKQDLIQPKDRIKIPKYQIKKVDRITTAKEKSVRENYYLNKDHTHFFLVDTGGIDHVGKETKFRQKFVKYVTERQLEELSDSELPSENKFVPAVSLVINGGLRTLAQVKENLFSGEDGLIMPVVIVSDTGRVADWFTFAYENDVSRYQELKEMIRKVYPTRYVQLFDVICMCMEHRQYISIYHPFQYQSLDEVVLRTIIKTGRNCREEFYASFEHFKLIMKWGNENVAKEELTKILKDEGVEPEIVKILLQELLIGALREQKMEFFDMILKIAFDLQDFDMSMLTKLYERVYLTDVNKQSNTLFTFLKPGKKELCLSPSTNVLSKTPFAPKQTNLLHCVTMEINKLLSLEVVNYCDDATTDEVEDPEKELFLWSVLCNKAKVASVLWKRGDDTLAKVLIARKMFDKMAKRYKTHHPFFDGHVYKKLMKHAEYFEMEALNLLEKCSRVSTRVAAELLDVSLPQWSDKSCMELAALSGFEQFIAHQRCQDIVEQAWRGDFALYGRYLHIKVITGIFCPPLLFTLKYKDSYRHDDTCCRSHQLPKRSFCKVRGWIDKIIAFYRAPVTKFWRNTVFYLFFLLNFAFYVLNRIGKVPLLPEYIVFAFIVTFLTDEIRSIFQGPGINLRQKIHAWWADPWNRIDCFAQLAFIVSLTLRLVGIIFEHDSLILYSRLTSAMNFVLWTLRLLQVISLHERIGVYVVMLQRMVGDVIYFIAICFVFILGYGIARTAILYPDLAVTFDTNMGENQNLGQKIFLQPIFQVIGEMFLDTNVNQTVETVFNTVQYDEFSQTFMLSLQFVYVIITNILFINLLIAVFNNTYESAQSHSDRIFKWQYYRMVNDIRDGSIFPAPFSIFGNFVYFSKSIVRKFYISKNRNPRKETREIPFTEYFEKDTLLNSLKQFENECLSKYLIEKEEYLQRMMRNYGGIGAPQCEGVGGGSAVKFGNQKEHFDGGFLLYGSDDDDD